MNDAEEKHIGEGGQKYRALRKKSRALNIYSPPPICAKKEKNLSLLLHYWPLKKERKSQ